MGDTNNGTPVPPEQYTTASDPFSFTPRSLTPSWHLTTPSHTTASHFYIENQLGDPENNQFLDRSGLLDRLASSGNRSKNDAIKVTIQLYLYNT
jgi:hypothetical protein